MKGNNCKQQDEEEAYIKNNAIINSMVQYLFLHSHFYSFITPLSATTKEKAKQE
jgi:hypothetical protein